MKEFSNNELRRLDLNLLLILLGLIRHGKAQDVATELGVTQSAVSQALKRLRDIFGDELFVRKPYGMEPTAVALALEPSISLAVETLRTAIGHISEFEPAVAQGTIRIAALDAEQAVLIPALSAYFKKHAPGLSIAVLPLGRDAAMQGLIEGRVDLSLGVLWEVPDTIRSQLLYDDGFLVAGSPEVLPEGKPLTIESYVAAEHVLVSLKGDARGIVDEMLEQKGMRRRIVLTLSAFLPALAAAATTGAIVTLPARVAQAFAPGFGMMTQDPPLDIRRFPVSVFWHRRDDSSAKRVWICQALEHICSTI